MTESSGGRANHKITNHQIAKSRDRQMKVPTRPSRPQAVRSKNRRMEGLSPKVPRVHLPTVFSANTLMPVDD